MKICIRCHESKDESNYTIDNSRKGGLHNVCKKCLKAKREEPDVKAERKEKNQIYIDNNKEALKERKRIFQKNLPNEVRAKYNREYRRRHAKEYYASAKIYREKNKYRYAYRSLLFNFLRRADQGKDASTHELLGYSVEKFKQRIETNFQDGMTWENHGLWHIDHKKPISAFKEGTPTRIVNALSNLQPLWSFENLSKANKFNLKT